MAESLVWTAPAQQAEHASRRTRRSAGQHAGLSRVVEAEIIPRLGRIGTLSGEFRPAESGSAESAATAASGADRPAPVLTLTAVAAITRQDVKHLSDAVLRQDLDSARALLNARYAAGVPLETIALQLLAGSARRLGELWDTDDYDFSSVTLGTGYLQQLFRELVDTLEDPFGVPGYHHRILLVPAPGDQHIFGTAILGDIFRRRGWDVWGGPMRDRQTLARLITREHFDVIGYSIGADRWLEPLAREIVMLREQSANARVRILIGGSAIDRCATLVDQLGGDAGATDPTTAPAAALALLAADAPGR
jgi:methanogenic corrinoid protein MtbC1